MRFHPSICLTKKKKKGAPSSFVTVHELAAFYFSINRDKKCFKDETMFQIEEKEYVSSIFLSDT
jgi:hypothetical protein